LSKKGLLEEIVVDKDYRGKGIGRKLIETAIDLARGEKVTRLELTSHPKRIEANKFYEHIGFKKRDTNAYRMDIS